MKRYSRHVSRGLTTKFGGPCVFTPVRGEPDAEAPAAEPARLRLAPDAEACAECLGTHEVQIKEDQWGPCPLCDGGESDV